MICFYAVPSDAVMISDNNGMVFIKLKKDIYI